MLFKVLLKSCSLLTVASLVHCIRVIDRKEDISIQDYCPMKEGCDLPGTHVLCLHNPNSLIWEGPACRHVGNVSMTESIALRILKVFNAFRRKIALGTETGKDGKILPRGYGLYQLDWDPELATFAQLWANQCRFQHDLCHATSRFSTPGQIIGLQRMKHPSWEPLQANEDSSTAATPHRVTRAILNLLKVWYSLKNNADVDDVKISTPKQYFQIVGGNVTHVGCGVSVFLEYSYNTQKVDLYFNTVILVCNFSSKVKPGVPAYSTSNFNFRRFLAGDKAVSERCGCPKETEEDQDSCLCKPIGRTENGDTCQGGICRPNVVLLPIVSVEDAILTPGSRNDVKSGKLAGITTSTSVPDKPSVDKPRNLPKRVKVTSNKSTRRELSGPLSDPLSKINSKYRTKSIFTRSQTFHLPQSKEVSMKSSNTELTPVIERRIMLDVAPRKNFDEAKNILKLYLLNRAMKKNNESYNLQHVEKVFTPNNKTTVVKRYFNNKNSIFSYNNMSSAKLLKDISYAKKDDDSDNKFLKLVDALEAEVSKIQYDTIQKEVINEKINKIYKTIKKIQNLDRSSEKIFLNESARIPFDRKTLQIQPTDKDVFKRPVKKVIEFYTDNFDSIYKRPMKSTNLVKYDKRNLYVNLEKANRPTIADTVDDDRLIDRNGINERLRKIERNHYEDSHRRHHKNCHSAEHTRLVRPVMESFEQRDYRSNRVFNPLEIPSSVYLTGRSRSLHGY